MPTRKNPVDEGLDAAVSIRSSDPFQRSSMLLGNLLSGDFEGAARAAGAPATLTPEERKSLVRRWFGNDPGPLEQALDVVTNPMVLAGLALTTLYKVPSGARYLMQKKALASYAKNLPAPLIWRIFDFHSIYKGTPLPEVFDHIQLSNHMHAMHFNRALANAIRKYETEAGRQFTRDVGIRIAAASSELHSAKNPLWAAMRERMGPKGRALLPPGTSPIRRITLTEPEVNLMGRVQMELSAQYKLALGITNRRGLFSRMRAMGLHVTGLPDPKGVYWPQIESLTEEQMHQRYVEWLAKIKGSGRVAEIVGKGAEARQAPTSLAKRTYRMLPNIDDLEQAGLAGPEVRKLFQEYTSLMEQEPGSPVVRHYGLQLDKTYEKYTYMMAKGLAWEKPVRPGYPAAVEVVGRELKTLQKVNPYKAMLLEGTYIPLMTGRQDWEMHKASQNFNLARMWAGETLEKLPIPESMKKVLRKPLVGAVPLTHQRLGNYIQSYLYHSTLGFNPVSPVKNITQSLITTLPLIGTKHFSRGLMTVLKRARKFVRLRMEGMPTERAFADSFTEFIDAGLDVGEWRGFDRLTGLSQYVTLGGKAKRVAGGLAAKSLWMFSKSEQFNRVLAFYGGRSLAKETLPGKLIHNPWTEKLIRMVPGTNDYELALNRVGARITQETQFGGGPLNTPIGILNSWMRWAPFRQFSQFPLRTLGFGVKALAGGKETRGVLGRILLTSGLTLEAAERMFGADLSGTLIFGAMPDPSRSGPFAPFPLVSPTLQVAGAGLQGIFSGDFENLQRSLPLGVPFGIQAARVASVAPGMQKLAPFIGRPYADWKQRTLDGRVPLYTKAGSLIGYYSPLQLMGKALGMGDLKGGKEKALGRYLRTQGERFGQFRKSWMDALLANDTHKMQKIQESFRKTYPGLGDLAIKPQDIQAVQMKREIPRLERMFASLPKQVRPAMAQVIATSMGAAAPGFLGTDPSVWAQSTPVKRWLQRPVRPAPEGMPGAQGRWSRGQVQAVMERLGEERRDETGTKGLEAFQSY